MDVREVFTQFTPLFAMAEAARKVRLDFDEHEELGRKASYNSRYVVLIFSRPLFFVERQPRPAGPHTSMKIYPQSP